MAGSTIVIEVDGLDISDKCLYEQCSFEVQMAAIPGSFTVVAKDMDQTLEFITGKELTLTVDGQLLFGGFVTQVNKRYAFPAADTVTNGPETLDGRQWLITGVDYNILLDKRVLRSDGDLTINIPRISSSVTDAEIIRDYFDNYFDIPAGFDFDTDAVIPNFTYDNGYTWPTQGVTMRDVLDDLAQWGAVYWIDANKVMNFRPVQDTAAPWGFSDVPNGQDIGDDPVPLIGYRDGEYTEDATAVVNDALVWGGSEWALDGDIVFDRRENTDSITSHGRWQVGEVHAGEEGYKLQSGVTARAKSIVDGNFSGTYVTGSKGLVNPEEQFRCTWFSNRVPTDGGDFVHLLPGYATPIELWVFSSDGGVTPYSTTLPLRQMSMSFPGLDPDGLAYIQFDGFFGVQMSDPFWLWHFLRDQRKNNRRPFAFSTANNGSVDPPYGAQYQGEPSPATDSSTTVFSIPFGYIPGSLRVYADGVLITTGITPSSPIDGEFEFAVAPTTGVELWVLATLTG